MLKNIAITGLGPYEERAEFPLNPDGTTVIVGASERGKSTIMDASVWAICGKAANGKAVPTAYINDGGDRASVDLELSTGTAFLRTVDRGRSNTRHIRRNGRETKYEREEDFAGALGRLGDDPEAVRVAMVPLAWRELAGNPGKGIRLRDMLARVLPDVPLEGVVKELMKGDWADGDPISESRAVEVRKYAGQDAKKAEGTVEALHDELKSLKELPAIEVPDVAMVATARGLIALGETWDEHTTANGAWITRNKRIARQDINRVNWRQRRKVIGDKPSGDGIDVLNQEVAAAEAVRLEATNARELAAKAATAHQTRTTAAGSEIHAATGRLQLAEKGIESVPDSDECPTCGGEWKGNVNLRRARAVVLESARDALKTAEAAHKALKADNDCDDRWKAAQEVEGQARRAVTLAEAKLAGVRQKGDRWEQRLSDMGDEPTVDEPTEAPTKLEGEAPAADAISEAEAFVTSAASAQGAATERADQLERLSKRWKAATRDAHNKKDEHERLDKLVTATRRAPSIAANRQLGALGDLGPVEVKIPTDLDSDTVIVTLDGRPWECASTGREIVGDLWLRAGLRRALKMPWLPLFVDNCGAVGGQALPDVGGPLILMRTTEDPRVRVVSKVTP